MVQKILALGAAILIALGIFYVATKPVPASAAEMRNYHTCRASSPSYSVAFTSLDREVAYGVAMSLCKIETPENEFCTAKCNRSMTA